MTTWMMIKIMKNSNGSNNSINTGKVSNKKCKMRGDDKWKFTHFFRDLEDKNSSLTKSSINHSKNSHQERSQI